MQTEKAGGTGINGRTKSPDKWAMPAADYVKIKFDGPFSTPHKKKKIKNRGQGQECYIVSRKVISGS